MITPDIKSIVPTVVTATFVALFTSVNLPVVADPNAGSLMVKLHDAEGTNVLAADGALEQPTVPFALKPILTYLPEASKSRYVP